MRLLLVLAVVGCGGTPEPKVHGHSPVPLDPRLDLVAWVPANEKATSAGNAIVTHVEAGENATWFKQYAHGKSAGPQSEPVAVKDGFAILHMEHDIIKPTSLYYRTLGGRGYMCFVDENDATGNASCLGMWRDDDELAIPFAWSGDFMVVHSGDKTKHDISLRAANETSLYVVTATKDDPKELSRPLPGGFEQIQKMKIAGAGYEVDRHAMVGKHDLLCTGNAQTLADAQAELVMCQELSVP